MVNIMKSIPCFSFALLFTFGLITFGSFATAQQGPFDETPTEEAAPLPLAKFKPKHLTVEVVLASNPNTPQGWIFAADVLAKHDEVKLAKEFLQKVLDANLDEAGWLKLTNQHGSVIFERIGANPTIQPEGKSVADAALGALAKKLGDRKRIQRLIGELRSPSNDTRIRAIAGLRKSGQAAAVPLLEVLADPKRESEFTEVRSVLEYLGKDAQRQLIAAARSTNATLAIQAIEVLKSTRASGASIYLLGPATIQQNDPAIRHAAEGALEKLTGRPASPAQAVQILNDRTKQYLDRLKTPLGSETLDYQVTIWGWDPVRKSIVSKKHPPRLADAMLASMLARDALAINPTNEKSRQMYLMAMLERIGLEAANDASIAVTKSDASEILRLGPGPIMTALENALLTNRSTAAIVAVKLLGQFRPEQMEALLKTGIKPTPLVRATRSGNRHLRFAALEVILALKPTDPFPGSSYIPEGLTFLASSTGERRAMVAARTTAEARRVGGFLTVLGYDIETATTGNEMMKKLSTSPDVEVILVDASIDKPKANILLQRLRRDGRMAGLPVAVMTPNSFTNQAERAAEYHPLAEAFPRPHDQKSVEWQLAQLAPRTARSATTPELRLQQAATALGHLNRLSQSKDRLFVVRGGELPALDAIYLPGLSGKAITLLGQLGTPTAQKALVDLASSELQPIADRQKALTAFKKSVTQKGTLLTTDQILLQYTRYNASKKSDRQTQQVLGSILDCIEAAK